MRKSGKKLISLLICMILVVSILTTHSFAYELNPYKITTPKTLTPYSGFTSTSITHMGYALGQWNAATGSTLATLSSYTHSSSSGFPSCDGRNYVYRIDVGADYVGLTHSWYINGNPVGSLNQADININVYHAFANSAQPGCYDLYSVFLHEAGHFFGLSDVSDSTPVMCSFALRNTTKRVLTQDDKNGIRALYG